MSGSAQSGYYRHSDNTKVPALSLILRQYVSGLVPGTTTTQTFKLASNPVASGQVSPVTAPLNVASTSSPISPTTGGAHGLRYFITHMLIADVSGTLRTSGSMQIQLLNTTQSNTTVFNTAYVSSGGSDPAGPQQAALYPVGAGQGGVSYVSAVRGTDTLALQLTMPGGSGTATSFTFALLGIFLP